MKVKVQMKLNSTPKPTAKVATSWLLRKCPSIWRPDASRPSERTKRRSCGSRNATATAPAAATPARTANPARQLIRSAITPVTSRPLNPPRLRSRRIDARGGRRFSGRPFVADIGHGHGEDRRQDETLHRAPEDDRRQAGRQPNHQSGDDKDKHRRDDHALAAEHVGHRAGERSGEGDRQGADGDDGRDFRRAGVKFFREQRKDRLRRIEIDEGAIPRKADREMTRGIRSAFGSGVHQGKPGGRVRVNARSYALVRWLSPSGKMAGLRPAQCIALSFQVERHPGANERFFRGAGRIDFCPVDAAQLEFFLILHDRRGCIGRVARPRADAFKP